MSAHIEPAETAAAASPCLALQPDVGRHTLPAFWDDVVSRHGDRVALRFQDRALTFLELDGEVRALARGLIAAGVVKGARVALLAANRPEWIIAAFAASRVGAVLVPVSTFATAPERDQILRHSDASVLIVQPSLLKRRYLEELVEAHPEIGSAKPGRIRCDALPSMRRIVALGLDESLGAIEPWHDLVSAGGQESDSMVDLVADTVTVNDDAMIVYTSGSSAEPKGVLHVQRAPVIQSWRFAELLRLSRDDLVWTAYPFFWTAGFAMSLGASLAAGATLVLEEVFDADASIAVLERHQVTTVHAWPHQEKALAEHPSAAKRDLRSIRKVNASSPLARLAGITEDLWGRSATYGLTETFTLVSGTPADAPLTERQRNHGRPLAGTQVRIVDPLGGSLLEPGRTGEIAVKGLTLMRGYHKVSPELTFDDEGFFHTGDAGYLDADGRLHWEGRLTGIIKTGGANVSPVEIEALLGSLPGLLVSAAVGVPHSSLGEVVVLCAVVETRGGLDEDTIREHLRGRLASYKIPRRVLFFGPDEVSFTGSQKIRAEPLREAALARLRAEGATIAGERYR